MTQEAAFLAAWEKNWKQMEQAGIQTARMREQAQKLGAVTAAKRCLSGRRCSDGFRQLMAAGLLHLSLEALSLKSAWGSLFTDEEANEALSRLMEAGYDFRK